MSIGSANGTLQHALGLDVGGANLKAACTDGRTASVPFAMWREADRLTDALCELASRFDVYHRVAVTMTGEMADCFETRRAGVAAIVEAVEAAFAGNPVFFWGVDGAWHSGAEASAAAWTVAASNWHAAATWMSHRIDKPAVWIDVGSTTTDVLSIGKKQVLSDSRTDLDRLRSGELIYTGVERSNVAGMLRDAQIEGVRFTVVNEQFATAADAYVLLGHLAAEPDNCQTADLRGRSLAECEARLSRAVAGDRDVLSFDHVRGLAEAVFEYQVKIVSDSVAAAFDRLRSPACDLAVISGHGDFLACAALRRAGFDGEVRFVSESLGAEVARVLPALAAAELSLGIHRSSDGRLN